MPKVSIIVPVYNVEQYLDECLQSLVHQTLVDVEIICIDDGSTDSSPTLLDAWAEQDERIVAIHQENAGVAHSRNVGLEKAQGEYVLFVDSDDYIALRTCEVLCALAEEKRADIVVFGGKTFPTSHWADASFAARSIDYNANSLDALLFEAGSNPLMCNKLYSLAFLNAHDFRFNESLILGEDNAFQFSVFPEAKTITYTPEMLYFYRGRHDSAVRSLMDDHSKKLFLHFDVVREVLTTWSAKGYLAGREKDMLSWATTFLYNEASLSYFNQRSSFAKDYRAFLDSVMPSLDAVVPLLDKSVADQFSFLMESFQQDALPRFSVVLSNPDRRSTVVEAFESWEFQTAQSVEIIMLVSPDDPQEYAAAVREYAEKDCRVRVVNESTVERALRAARGEYVLQAFLNETFETTSLKQIEDALGDPSMPDEEVEVITFADSAELLGVKNVYDFYQPSATDDIRAKKLFSVHEVGSGVFALASLALSNKIVRRTSLLACLDEGGEGSVAQVALYTLLSRSQAILPTQMPLVTVRPLQFSDEARMKEVVDRLVSHLGATAAQLERSSFDPAFILAFHQAAFMYVLKLWGLCFAPGRNEAGYEALKRYFEETGACHALTQACEATELAASAEDFFSNDYQRFSGRMAMSALDHLIVLNSENLLAVGNQAGIAARLGRDIDEFYNSISYRVGRMVTLIPRKIANMMGKK